MLDIYTKRPTPQTEQFKTFWCKKKQQYLPLNIYPFLIIKSQVAIMLYAMLMVCYGNL